MNDKVFTLNIVYRQKTGLKFAGLFADMWSSIYLKLLTIFRNFIYSKNLNRLRKDKYRING
jgi:hypothetical protein